MLLHRRLDDIAIISMLRIVVAAPVEIERSALVEQSTPSIHRISDEFASVSNISFKDLDLDRDEIGGLVSWESPDKPDLVEGHLARNVECEV